MKEVASLYLKGCYMKISYSLGNILTNTQCLVWGGDSGKMYTIITQLYERWICR